MVENVVEALDQAQALLERAGQPDLLADLNQREGDSQKALAEQIVRLEGVTPGGLQDYCERARRLLESSRNNVNPFDAFKPEVPAGVFLEPSKQEFEEMEDDEEEPADILPQHFKIIEPEEIQETAKENQELDEEPEEDLDSIISKVA